jgi:hypothetical protein
MSPGFWNLLFNSLKNLEYSKISKVISYAVDLLILVKGKSQVAVEHYAIYKYKK